MITKKITITNRQGYNLAGLLNLNRSSKLIIICNGYDCTKEFASIRLLAEGLSDKGYDVFRFDFSGTGESQGPKNIFIKQQVDDLNSVVNFFKNYQTITLLGGSLGALSATLVSITNPQVTNLITVNGFFGGHELGQEVRKTYLLYRLASFLKSDYRKDYQFFKNNLLPEKIKIPVWVMYSKTDEGGKLHSI